MAHALALAIIQAPATRKNGPSSVRRRAAGRSAQRHHRLPGVGADRESSSAAALASTLDESAVALEQPAPGPVSGVGLVETMGLERVTARRDVGPWRPRQLGARTLTDIDRQPRATKTAEKTRRKDRALSRNICTRNSKMNGAEHTACTTSRLWPPRRRRRCRL